jgi:uncharacterized protein (TIGR00255 family)
MTGFGQADSVAGEDYYYKVEIRSVNHRFLDIAVRLPRDLQALEERVRCAVQQAAGRGRVEVSVFGSQVNAGKKRVILNRSLAESYYRALYELSEVCGEGDLPGAELLSGFPEVLSLENEAPDLETAWSVLAPVINRALAQLVEQRRAEGERLASDIRQRLLLVESYLAELAGRAPAVADEYRKKLTERLKEYLGGCGLDEARLFAEAALFADRSNITEELVRLRSHLAYFRQTMALDETVGRKLDFLAQELFREINTIGSKAGDFELARLVVEIKAELEKVREQVQNIE